MWNENHTNLDNLKKMNENIQKKTLSKLLINLKKKAKEIYKLKYFTNSLLNECWISEKESKAIIDWINSLWDIQLNEDDKKEIKEEVKQEIKETKKKVEKKFEESYIENFWNWYWQLIGWVPVPYTVTYTNNTNSNDNLALKNSSFWSNMVLCSTKNWWLEIK